jgi:hypothetical protein
MPKTVIAASEYRSLPLAQLHESPTNPRRRFDERALQELAAISSFSATDMKAIRLSSFSLGRRMPPPREYSEAV